MDAIALTKALRKGKWHGSYGTACCPAHRDRTPSLSIGIGRDGRTLVCCHTGCSQETVIAALKLMGLWDGEVASNVIPFTPRSSSENSAHAVALFADSAPAAGTIVETYLRSRGIKIPVPDALRFHPNLAYPGGGSWPAMVALVNNAHGMPAACHRTYLRPDGSGKAPVPTAKMSLGPCAGNSVHLSEPAQRMGVGEGIETALSILDFDGIPMLAALSTGGLKNLILPKVVKKITIFADADAPGEDAAVTAGRAWKVLGLDVKISRPPAGSDFNDWLIAQGRAS